MLAEGMSTDFGRGFDMRDRMASAEAMRTLPRLHLQAFADAVHGVDFDLFAQNGLVMNQRSQLCS